ncbi:translation initiation inhibitor [Thraustotheca clavata]|uniref:Translation initiation inhibitor n=1 Tax=Thraustotheca clavata TaxID=74557 RepID=A0A1V9Z6D8_9STRA|nr:translation initiation inhibitor [Thraustotheca clavata]
MATPIVRKHVEGRYSEVVVHNGTVYLSGQLADNLDGGIEQQTRETLESIDQFLSDAGTSKERLLSVTIYLKDMADYAGMNAIWDAWVVKGATPARTTVQAALYDPKVLVEMTVMAAL